MGWLRGFAALASGWGAGMLLARRLGRRTEERVDVYFEDGSLVSLDGSSPEAQRLLPLARDLLGTVGPPR
jgi:hypothetical protein